MSHESVLIVDDDAAVLRGLNLRLTAAGYHCVLCHNGASALELASSRPPDAIVVDGSLPDMDGIDFIRILSDSSEVNRIPVIVVSGAEEKRNGVLDAGARAFLLKPYDGKQLIAAVTCAVAKPRVGGPGQPSAAIPRGA